LRESENEDLLRREIVLKEIERDKERRGEIDKGRWDLRGKFETERGRLSEEISVAD